MSLIEQLGGHEKAKAKRDDIDHTLENCEFLGGGDAREGLYETLGSIEQALLEYRRQHNIFETGDPVVLSSLNGIGVFESYVNTSKDHCFLKYGQDSIFARLEYVKHAPPEQIKTSKRLEVDNEK